MKEILLTKGKVAFVDDEDYENLNQFKWHYSKSGYAVRSLRKPNRHMIYMHREILKLKKSNKRTFVVDHINHNTTDNRKENLRICSGKENSRNKRKTRGKQSVYKGAHLTANKERWVAAIIVNKKRRYLSTFDTEIEAAKAYNEAAKKYFGEFANLNKIEE